jgi:hypothetical protein
MEGKKMSVWKDMSTPQKLDFLYDNKANKKQIDALIIATSKFENALQALEKDVRDLKRELQLRS